MVERKIPTGRRGTLPYLDWPSSAATWRTLTAYWSVTLPMVMPGRILNFWQVIGAVTSRIERSKMFSNLEHSRTQPVWSKIQTHLGKELAGYVTNSSTMLK